MHRARAFQPPRSGFQVIAHTWYVGNRIRDNKRARFKRALLFFNATLRGTVVTCLQQTIYWCPLPLQEAFFYRCLSFICVRIAKHTKGGSARAAAETESHDIGFISILRAAFTTRTPSMVVVRETSCVFESFAALVPHQVLFIAIPLHQANHGGADSQNTARDCGYSADGSSHGVRREDCNAAGN